MIVDLSGKIGYNQLVEPDQKYKRWTLDLYLDDESKQKFQETGLQNEFKKDQDGEEYIRLGRSVQKIIKDELVKFTPPSIWYNQKKYNGKFIPKGSDVTVRMEVYTTIKGPGSRIEKVRIDILAEYVRSTEARDEVPF